MHGFPNLDDHSPGLSGAGLAQAQELAPGTSVGTASRIGERQEPLAPRPSVPIGAATGYALREALAGFTRLFLAEGLPCALRQGFGVTPMANVSAMPCLSPFGPSLPRDRYYGLG